MKNLNKIITIILFSVWFLNTSLAQNPTYSLEAKNFVYTGDNILEFEVRMINTSNGDFEYAGASYFLSFDPLISTNGNFTLTIIDSDLPVNMRPRNPTIRTASNPPATVLVLNTNSLPGAGNGYMIPHGSPGILIARVRLQTSTEFFRCGYLNMEWRNPPIPINQLSTRIFAYVNGSLTTITTPATHSVYYENLHWGCSNTQIWLDLYLSLEGLIVSANSIEPVKLYLRSALPPYIIYDSLDTFIFENIGMSLINFSSKVNPGYYYIVIKHRNSIETWSKEGGVYLHHSLGPNPPNFYDFASADSQAYGNNLKQIGNSFFVYSGDVNQDGSIDIADMSLVDNDVNNYTTGYNLSTDLNMDSIVDLNDLLIVDNNAANLISVRNPIVGDAPESQVVKKRKLSMESKKSQENNLSNDSKNLPDVPEKFILKDNYPNPFNPTTKIIYSLPKAGNVSLKIFDITGREVSTLVNENQNAGKYSVEWDASKFSSGTYFYKIVSGEFSQVKRMILVK